MENLVWFIPALPLLGFVLLLLFGKRMGSPLSGWLATVDGGRLVRHSRGRVLLVARPTGADPREVLFEWIPPDRSASTWAYLLDPLSMAMVLFITGVATLIHLYSIGYMHGDPRYPQVLPVPEPVRLLDVGVGARRQPAADLRRVGRRRARASYFLISFSFEKVANAVAGKKAFVTNRVVTGASWSAVRDLLRLRHDQLRRLPAAGLGHGHDRGHLHRPDALHRASASRPRSPSTSGSPTPWPARRRCRP